MQRRPLDEATFENNAVLAAVQALIGSITPNMIAIAVKADHRSRSVELLFAVEALDETDAEEITEAGFELDVLLWPEGIAVTTSTWIGTMPFQDGWPGIDQRRVFGRH